MENIDPPWLKNLLDPSSYPDHPEEVRLIQTHLSWVFIAGEFVYKVKKPVDFGFLDFTTLGKRRFFCDEEIRLNKRLCPDIYLDVVPVNRQEGRFRMEGPGETVEWAVKMKHMPDEGLMSSLVKRDEIEKKDIENICSILSPFYETAKAPPGKVWLGGIDVIRENCRENFRQTKEFAGNVFPMEVFENIKGYTVEFIEKNQPLFEKRQKEGRIVEGHGDLYTANICFDRERDNVYIFDCIEFNERFRYGDIVADVAFLSMDLDFLGLCDLSAYFIEIFKEKTRDQDFFRLLDFYRCYRAYVRGKIGCFTWASAEVDQKTRSTSIEMARRYFQLALRYAGGQEGKPTLFVFMGLSGAGKSTVARAFSEHTGLKCFNSDYVRKRHVCGIPSGERRFEPFGRGIYSRRFTEKTYRALSRLAGERLVLGQSAILDATYIDKQKRDKVRELARSCGARLILVNCTCPEGIALERMRKRMLANDTVSDGRQEIYENQKQLFVPPEQSEADMVIELDTSRSVEEALNSLERLISGK